MFSPEDTICGFVAGLTGRPLADVQPGHTLLDDLGLEPHDLATLARLIENEYGVEASADEILSWKRIQDVTGFVHLKVEPTSGAPMGHPTR